jgi:membrane-associated phospholipid phosphatase
MLSRVVCGLFYIFLPTHNPVMREAGAAFVAGGNTFSEQMMQFLFVVDQPTNLLPSIHCLVSWLCFMGIRGKKEIPFWYRTFSCIFAILVFVSTQVTKQHYYVDIIAAVIVAEGLYYITKRTNVYKYFYQFFEMINTKLKRS